jgi:hypothetical protein
MLEPGKRIVLLLLVTTGLLVGCQGSCFQGADAITNKAFEKFGSSRVVNSGVLKVFQENPKLLKATRLPHVGHRNPPGEQMQH